MAACRFAQVACELLQGAPLASRDQAQRERFLYVEAFYKRCRQQSAFGYLCLLEFDKAWQARTTAP